jgi:hypothetical protein
MLSMDQETFIAALADVPPKPAGMDQILASNRGTARVEPTA